MTEQPLVDHMIEVHGFAYLRYATGLTSHHIAALQQDHSHDHRPYPGNNWDQHHQHSDPDALVAAALAEVDHR